MQINCSLKNEVNNSFINIIHNSFEKIKLIVSTDMNNNPISNIELALCNFFINYDDKIENIYACSQYYYGFDTQEDIIVKIINRELSKNINKELDLLLKSNNYGDKKQKIYQMLYGEREYAISLLLSNKYLYKQFINDDIKKYKFNKNN